MDGNEGGMLFVINRRAADQILQQQQVPRTPLDDREQPVPKLEITAPRIRLLLCNKSRKIGFGRHQFHVRRQGGVKGSHEGAVKREVWEMREQN
jgi:hypothetical protein